MQLSPFWSAVVPTCTEAYAGSIDEDDAMLVVAIDVLLDESKFSIVPWSAAAPTCTEADACLIDEDDEMLVVTTDESKLSVASA
jgi:hypothetical protein